MSPGSLAVGREDGHKLYFRAALTAVALFALAALVDFVLFACASWYRWLNQYLLGEIGSVLKDPVKPGQSQLVLFSLYTVAIGLIAPHALNLIHGKQYWYRREVKKNEFEDLLFRAMANRRPVAVSMERGKVYVGFVTQVSTAGQSRDWVPILPLMSGYRREPDKEVTFTTFYDDLYQAVVDAGENLPPPLDHLKPEDFEMVLPISKIVSLNIFDVTAYAEFQRRRSQGDRFLAQGTVSDRANEIGDHALVNGSS